VVPSIIKRKDKLISVLTLFFAMFFLFLLLFLPEYFKESTKNAVYLCINSVIPSLFCFIVISKIIVSSGVICFIAKILGKPFNALTGLNPIASGIFLVSFLSGYPAGAVAVTDLYAQGELKKDEAEKLVAVCNNTGPALPVLLLGSGLPGSAFGGWAIYVIEVLSALICARIMKKGKKRYEWSYYPSFTGSPLKAVTASVSGTLFSVALLCAYVLLFSCVVSAVSLLPFGKALLPFAEIVSGSFALTDSHSMNFVILSGALSFGGLCVHMQTAAVCVPHGLSVKEHFRYKLMCALVSSVLACVYVLVR